MLFALCPFFHLTSAKLLLGFISLSSQLSLSDSEFHCPLGFLSFSFRFATHRVIRYNLKLSDFDIHCPLGGLVEIKGFEPLTPCLQGRCSPS